MFNSEDSGCVDPLYSKVQRFFVKSTSSEERSRDLRIVVDFASSFSKVSKQVLNVQVSDDEDPFFFYSLVLTEDDYQRLKSLQGLLVDFDNFPSQVIRLLEQCSQEEGHDSKFHLILEEERKDNLHTYLKIVEANNFKHLCHLTLQIQPGNDSDIKNLMLKKIKHLKDHNSKAEKLISSLESQLQHKSKQLQSTEEKLHQVQEQWREDKIAFKAESTKEITEETEKFRKSQLDWQIRSQREKAEIEEKYQTMVKDRDADLSRLRLENQILLEKRGTSDLTISDQARRLEQLEKELITIRNDLSSTRKHATKQESENHEREKVIHTLKTKIAVLEQELKDKTILMSKQQELLNVANDQKTRLEDVITEKDKNIQRKQLSLQNLSDELVKANEIITKMQKELAVINSKMQMRTTIALEQEKVVESHLKTITRLEEANKNLEKKITSNTETELSLKTTISELRDLIETKEKKIKDNERIIDWLNRRLTEQSKPLSTSPGTTSTPYSRFGTETTIPRVPFTSRAPAVTPIASVGSTQLQPPTPSISHLDQHQTPIIPEESENTTPNLTGNGEIKEKEEKKNTEQKPIKKQPKKPAIGFRRVPLGQPSTVPSSYFLK
ncbi:spindle assembly abnormal protein 6 homolog [Cimex lectularius]|uniref:Spindle assembly abnormal protein 6 N-terminal domain-containing protein n=1 Tax=Cimex lectularius TaxID=79782 RepID=A0A8I6R9S6_CIMLE|nr:spindle assembly abnormal protein 6 homolog [Cimex lectularius]